MSMERLPSTRKANASAGPRPSRPSRGSGRTLHDEDEEATGLLPGATGQRNKENAGDDATRRVGMDHCSHLKMVSIVIVLVALVVGGLLVRGTAVQTGATHAVLQPRQDASESTEQPEPNTSEKEDDVAERAGDKAVEKKKEEERSREEDTKKKEEDNRGGEEAVPADDRTALEAERDALLKRYTAYAAPTPQAAEEPAPAAEEWHWDENKTREQLSSLRQTQIENYRKGIALMFNLHPTHHGGTAFCEAFRHEAPGAPAFACMGDRDEVMPVPPNCSVTGEDTHRPIDPHFCYAHEEMMRRLPWSKNETEPFLRHLRRYFRLQVMEFRPWGSGTFALTDWEHPELVSVVVTRDPLSRLLAGDGLLGRPDQYQGWNLGTLSRSKWWDLAVYHAQMETDNFFLRTVLRRAAPARSAAQRAIQNHVEHGLRRSTGEAMELFPTGLNETHFEAAKALLHRFTFVLDIDCLTEGMTAMAQLLGVEGFPKQGKVQRHAKPKERIGYDDVYEYLFAKNQWDIALYEHSKTISLVKCDSL